MVRLDASVFNLVNKTKNIVDTIFVTSFLTWLVRSFLHVM